MSGRGAGDRVPYCLRVTPRVQVAHFPEDFLCADTRRPSMAEVLAMRRACKHLSTRPSVFVGLTCL